MDAPLAKTPATAAGGRTWRRPAFGTGSVIFALALAYLGNQVGWWWATVLAGALIAVGVRRFAVLPAAAAGAAAWGVDLAVQARHGGVGRVAQVTASLAGFGNDAATTLVTATVIYGALLCLIGAWVASAVRSVAGNRPGRRAKTPPAAPVSPAPAGTAPSTVDEPALVTTASKEHSHG